MAGETRGELAEAITVAAPEFLTQAMEGKVFWERRPTGALVLPDVTLG